MRIPNGADGMPAASSRHYAVDIACFQNFLLIVFMGDGFFRHYKAGPDLNAFRAQNQHRCQSSAISDASGADDRNLYLVRNLRN